MSEGERAPLLSRQPADRVLAVAVAVVAFALSWYRHVTFRSTIFDLAVFDQAVWKLANGRAPEVTVTGWNTFGDHFSPVLLAFVPLYRLRPTPAWLFGAQALAAGVGMLALRPLLDAVRLPRVRQWALVAA